MAVLVADVVLREPCGECPRVRVLATEREGADLLRVTVLDGCDTCEGSHLTIQRP